jgi:ATP-dependent Clp protease ATP-binding subunit ClpA
VPNDSHDFKNTVLIMTSNVDWIADHGYQPEFGARPMRRVIQREVDNPAVEDVARRTTRRGPGGHGRP